MRERERRWNKTKKRTKEKKETKHIRKIAVAITDTTIKMKLKCQVKCEESFATPKKYCFCHCNDGIILPIWQCVHNAFCHYFCVLHSLLLLLLFCYFFRALCFYFCLFRFLIIFMNQPMVRMNWQNGTCASDIQMRSKINHYHTDKHIEKQKYSVRCCKNKWKKNSNALDKCEIKERKMYFNTKDGSKEERKKNDFWSIKRKLCFTRFDYVLWMCVCVCAMYLNVAISKCFLRVHNALPKTASKGRRRKNKTTSSLMRRRKRRERTGDKRTRDVIYTWISVVKMAIQAYSRNFGELSLSLCRTVGGINGRKRWMQCQKNKWKEKEKRRNKMGKCAPNMDKYVLKVAET